MYTISRLNSPSDDGSVEVVDHPEAVGPAAEFADDQSSLCSDKLEDGIKSVLDSIKKRSITILLIGETGCGKTAFLSLILNLFQGKGPLELEDLNDGKAESGLSSTQSQTTTATLYSITTSEGNKIRILDTPGLADTRGIEQDNIHKAEINKAIKEFVETIDAVMIMANGTVERLTPSTDYTLNVISSMFPRSILDNIGFIFTNSDPATWNFNLEGLQPELQESQFWLIQNPLAMTKNLRRNGSRFRNPKQIAKTELQLRTCYQDTVETLNEWLVWLDERQVQPTTEIDRLYHMSITIESHIEMAIAHITRLSEQRIEYEKIARNLEKSTAQAAKALKAFERQQAALVWGRKTTTSYNTICLHAGCFKNCHVKCRQVFGNWNCQIFSWYGFFSKPDTKCSECGHKRDDHGHYQQLHDQQPDKDPKIKQAHQGPVACMILNYI
ncbi:hypothetical protein FRC12_009746 [Ceratobasidium sp. 428]|nr:hypothetical protein FRC12_009746 [Ceratobasidium sp. 428]